jgi:hypothetical protein
MKSDFYFLLGIFYGWAALQAGAAICSLLTFSFGVFPLETGGKAFFITSMIILLFTLLSTAGTLLYIGFKRIFYICNKQSDN